MTALSSFRWKREAVHLLGDNCAPDFPTITDIALVVDTAGGPGTKDGQATKTARRLADDLIEAGDLVRLRRDLYLNRLKRPIPSPEAAASVIRPACVVSLHSVLGAAGVLNNPSRSVFALVPVSPGKSHGHRREVDGELADFRFVSISATLLNTGLPEDRLDAAFPYPRATPERAFADWLYLVARRSSSNLRPFAEGQGLIQSAPPLDVDLGRLDMDRLERCCGDLDVTADLAEFLRAKEAHDADPDVEEMSGRFW